MDINRSIFNMLHSEISEPQVSILLGARQVGKSFLLNQLQQSCIKLGKATRYFNLELPTDLQLFSGDDQSIYDLILNSGDIVFIDEFHYARNISQIFKAIYDSKKRKKIFASGSSSLEIHKHLKESLAGRRLVSKISPLSYSETSQWNSSLFDYYLIYGGMPGLIHASDESLRQRMLQEIVETYLQKDVKSLVKEENLRSFNHLLFLVAEWQGSVINLSSLASEIGLSHKSIANYLEIMEATYTIHSVPSYSTNLANELKKSRKLYLYDLGIRNMLRKDFSEFQERDDRGVLLESFIFLELSKVVRPNTEIRFWRTKHGDEVDFVWLENRIPIPIEVKSKIKGLDDVPGIKKFLSRYRKAPRACVFSESLHDTVVHDNRPVRFLPFQALQNKPIDQLIRE